MVFTNSKVEALKSALTAAEDLRKVTAMNIANSETIGYKAYQAVIAPNCECQCFSDILPEVAQKLKEAGYSATPSGYMHVEMQKDNKSGKKVNINGKNYEGSNVDPSQEITNLVTAAALTRSALAALQLENRMQQEILNLGKN